MGCTNPRSLIIRFLQEVSSHETFSLEIIDLLEDTHKFIEPEDNNLHYLSILDTFGAVLYFLSTANKVKPTRYEKFVMTKDFIDSAINLLFTYVHDETLFIHLNSAIRSVQNYLYLL